MVRHDIKWIKQMAESTIHICILVAGNETLVLSNLKPWSKRDRDLNGTWTDTPMPDYDEYDMWNSMKEAAKNAN